MKRILKGMATVVAAVLALAAAPAQAAMTMGMKAVQEVVKDSQEHGMAIAMENAVYKVFGPLFKWVFAPVGGGLQSFAAMAYSGSTALTSLANPPRQIAHGGGPIQNQSGNLLGIAGTSIASTLPFVGGCSLWYYCSSDSATIASSPGYFTDGLTLGLRAGDVMLVVNQSSYGTSPSFSIGVIGTSNSTAGFNLVIGGVIQSS